MMHPDDSPDRPVAADAPLEPELRAAAQHYRVPPSVPADAMWAALQVRRGRAAVPDAEPATPLDPPRLRVEHRPRGRGVRPRSAWHWTSLAAAAVLLVSVGIGIGRHVTPGGAVVAAGSPLAARPATAPPPGGTLAARGVGTGAGAARADGPATPMPPAVRDPGPSARPVSGAPVAVAVAPTPPRAADAGHATPGGTSAGVASPTVASTDVGATDVGATDVTSSAPSAPLRAATVQHLARAEALLTTFAVPDPGAAFGSAPGDARPPATPDAAWARDLLTTTRLLLDSPAGRDPSRRALLEDLELILGQIARLPRTDTPDERALIDRAIRRGDLMAKLRTAVPAGAPTSASARGS